MVLKVKGVAAAAVLAEDVGEQLAVRPAAPSAGPGVPEELEVDRVLPRQLQPVVDPVTAEEGDALKPQIGHSIGLQAQISTRCPWSPSSTHRTARAGGLRSAWEVAQNDVEVAVPGRRAPNIYIGRR